MSLREQIARKATKPWWRKALRGATRFVPGGVLIDTLGEVLLNPDPVADGTIPPWIRDKEKDNKPNPNPPEPPQDEDPPSDQEPPQPQPKDNPEPAPRPVTFDIDINITQERQPAPVIPPTTIPENLPSVAPRRLPPLPQTFDEQNVEVEEKKLLSVRADGLKKVYGQLIHSPITKSPAKFYQIEPNELGAEDPVASAKKYYEYLIRKIHGSQVPQDLVGNSVLAFNLIPNNFLRFSGSGEMSMLFKGGLEEIANNFRASSENAFQSITGKGQINVVFEEFTPKKETEQQDEYGLQPDPSQGTPEELEKIYDILGGDLWFQEEEKPQVTEESLEAKLRESAQTQKLDEDEGKTVTHGNLIEYLQNLTAIPYHRSGGGEYPAEVPPTLLSYTDQDEAQSISNAGKFFEWYIQQFDALIGQFPIQIDVTDNDPSQPGNQTERVELANISETLAELFGITRTSNINSNTAINFLSRLSAEVIATKNSSLITQDYVKANAAYLGYKGNPKRQEVTNAFNPDQLNDLEQLLQRSKKYIVGWQNDDKESIAEYLPKLMFAAGIIKQVFFREGKRGEELKGEMGRLFDTKKEEAEEEWEQFLDELNSQTSRFNQGQNTRPRAKDRS
jgi:hypothetical protein